MTTCRALVVEDEPANQDFLVRLVTQVGFEVMGARDGGAALQAVDNSEYALVIIDLELPDIGGLELLRRLRPLLPDAVLMVASMWDEQRTIAEAFEAGCDVFLVKPHGFMEMYRRLQGWPCQRDQLQNLLIDQYGPRPYRH